MTTGQGSAVPMTFHRSAPQPATIGAHPRPAPRAKKAFVRRRGDRSQRIRAIVQGAFATVALWVGVQFYLWVRYYETSGASLPVSRPPGVEAWLPIAALMNTKALLLAGAVPPVHPAGMFMFLAFVAISLLLRKAFCSWVCPVGTLSEALYRLGGWGFGRTFTLPRWVDIPLRGIKYILLALVLYVVITMPVPDIHAFLESPYGLVADVKMLDFFRRMGQTTAVVLGVLIVGSVLVKNFWCRLMCPYGALMGLIALASPARIVRKPDACIDCAKCAAACPAGLPVDTALSIRSAECNACLSCVAVCPAAGALDLEMGFGGSRWPLRPRTVGLAVIVVFLAFVGYAQFRGQWHTQLSDGTYRELIPRASQFAHPRQVRVAPTGDPSR